MFGSIVRIFNGRFHCSEPGDFVSTDNMTLPCLNAAKDPPYNSGDQRTLLSSVVP